MSDGLPLIKLHPADPTTFHFLKPPALQKVPSSNPSNTSNNNSNISSPHNDPNAQLPSFLDQPEEETKKRRSKSPYERAMEHSRKAQAHFRSPLRKVSKKVQLNHTFDNSNGKNNNKSEDEQLNALPLMSPIKRRISSINRDMLSSGAKLGTGSALKNLFKRKVNALTAVRRFGNEELEALPEEDFVEAAISILQKTFLNRSTLDMKILMKCMSNVDFFKNYDEKTVQKCLRKMYHKELRKGETVFEIDTIGTTFWVVLKGSISIWIHNKQMVLNEKGEEVEEKLLVFVKKLPSGTAFGELALMTNKPRNATIICEEHCHFAVLDKAPFVEILKDKEMNKQNQEIEFLGSLLLFKGWSFHSIKSLLQFSLTQLKFKRAQVLYSEGDSSSKMYIIKSGEFKVLKHIDIEDEIDCELRSIRSNFAKFRPVSRLIEVAILGERELIGAEEFIYNVKRRYRVECSKEAEVYEISRKEFFNPGLTFNLSAKWLNQYITLKKKHYEERVLEVQKAHKDNNQFIVFKREGPKSQNISQAKIESYKEHLSANMALHLNGFSTKEHSPPVSTKFKPAEIITNRAQAMDSNERVDSTSPKAAGTREIPTKEPIMPTNLNPNPNPNPNPYPSKRGSRISVAGEDLNKKSERARTNPRGSKISSANLSEADDLGLIPRAEKKGPHARLMASSLADLSLQNRKYGKREAGIPSLSQFANFSRRPSQPADLSSTLKNRLASLTPDKDKDKPLLNNSSLYNGDSTRNQETTAPNTVKNNEDNNRAKSLPQSPEKVIDNKNPYKKMIFDKMENKFQKLVEGTIFKIEVREGSMLERKSPYLVYNNIITGSTTDSQNVYSNEKVKTDPATPNNTSNSKPQDKVFMSLRIGEVKKGSFRKQRKSAIIINGEGNQKVLRKRHPSYLSNISVEDNAKEKSLMETEPSHLLKTPEKAMYQNKSFLLEKPATTNKESGYNFVNVFKRQGSLS